MDALPRTGGGMSRAGGYKKKTRLPAHVGRRIAVHCYRRLHAVHLVFCFGDGLCCHEKGPGGFGEIGSSELELAGRGSYRGETREKKRRLQVDVRSRRIQNSTHSTAGPRGGVGVTQEAVSCLTSRLEPALESFGDGRQVGQEKRCRVCHLACGGLPGHFPGCAAVVNSSTACHGRESALWCCLGYRERNRQWRCLLVALTQGVVNFAFHGAQCGF
ncbi:hypothetical protein QBC39DRAFT_343764 [Podospora conica]|nr:hypothetical protein QBC39DRAFT_343764 [Schizothecium conicum]